MFYTLSVVTEETSADSPAFFFGYIGVACALVFANLGAAYGTAKSGVGISSMGVVQPGLIMKSIIPVVMAGILGIYGMIVQSFLDKKSKKMTTIISEDMPIYLLVSVVVSHPLLPVLLLVLLVMLVLELMPKNQKFS